MTAPTEFNKETLKAIRADINAALAAVAKKHGMSSLTIGNITYGADNFSSKLTAIKPSQSSTSIATPTPANARELKWQKAFKSGCIFWGLSTSDLGKTVTVSGNGKSYTGKIVGARAKAANAPIILDTGNNRLLYCPIEMVKAGLNKGA